MNWYAVTVEIYDKNIYFQKIDNFQGQNEEEAVDNAREYYFLLEVSLERIISIKKIEQA